MGTLTESTRKYSFGVGELNIDKDSEKRYGLIAGLLMKTRGTYGIHIKKYSLSLHAFFGFSVLTVTGPSYITPPNAQFRKQNGICISAI